MHRLDTQPLEQAATALWAARHAEHDAMRQVAELARAYHTAGVPEAELVDITGLARKTIRRILGKES